LDDHKELNRQQFGKHAQDYVLSADHAEGRSLKRLLESTQPQPDWVTLDVSTGGGHTALAFAPYVRRVVATDLSAEMLAAAAKFALERGAANIEFKIADAENLPFGDAEFDLVTNRIALHHYPDARKAISEMARVCKHGGMVALSDNIVPPEKATAGHINHWEQLRDRSHHWAYPAARLESMFADAGLQVEHTESLSKELEFDAWADRMGAGEELKAKLRHWLSDAPAPVRAWLVPRRDGDRLFFTLHEAIIVARKV
jgi:ubiquinone/menaquinone biosynthesis C-methylase UbiE